MIIARLFKGAAAGFVATAPMTLAMLVMHKLLPWPERYSLPPAQITTKAARKVTGLWQQPDRSQRLWLTLLTHFAFGAGAGAIYGLLAGQKKLTLPPLVSGNGFGLIVWASSYLGWLPASKILPHASDQPLRRNVLMIVAHLVWGSVTGWLFERFNPAEAEGDLPQSDKPL